MLVVVQTTESIYTSSFLLPGLHSQESNIIGIYLLSGLLTQKMSIFKILGSRKDAFKNHGFIAYLKSHRAYYIGSELGFLTAQARYIYSLLTDSARQMFMRMYV